LAGFPPGATGKGAADHIGDFQAVECSQKGAYDTRDVGQVVLLRSRASFSI
jgi:hypothetical protein